MEAVERHKGARERSALFTWAAGLAATLAPLLLRSAGMEPAARGAVMVQGALFLVLLAWLLPRFAAGPEADLVRRWQGMSLHTALGIYGVGLLPSFADGALLVAGRGGPGPVAHWLHLAGAALQILAVALAASALKPVPAFPRLPRALDAPGGELEGFLSGLGACLEEAVLLLDPAGRILQANDRAADLMAVPAGSLAGRRLLEALSFLAPPEAERILKAVEEGRPLEGVLGAAGALATAVLPVAEGRSVLLLKRQSPPQPRLDDLEQVRLERMLALGGVVAGVARELNNPLTGLLGFLELAAGHEGLAEEPRADLQRAVEEGRRCRLALDNLLAFTSRETPGARTVDLVELVREVLTMVERQFRFGGFSLVIELPDRPLPVLASPSRLRLVILNLLHHAYRSAMQGGWQVTVRASLVGSRARLEILDSGPALPEDGRAALFALPGEAAEEAAELGLIVARRVVRDHHGTLECLSGEGAGNILLMELPVVRTALAAGALAGLPEPLANALLPAPGTGGGRVLLAAPANSRTAQLAPVLKSLGHVVELCTEPAAGSGGDPDVVIADSLLAGSWLASLQERGAHLVVVGGGREDPGPEGGWVTEADYLLNVLSCGAGRS